MNLKFGIGYHDYIPTEANGYMAGTTILFSSAWTSSFYLLATEFGVLTGWVDSQ
jgi:hypothetical protein